MTVHSYIQWNPDFSGKIGSSKHGRCSHQLKSNLRETSFGSNNQEVWKIEGSRNRDSTVQASNSVHQNRNIGKTRFTYLMFDNWEQLTDILRSRKSVKGEEKKHILLETNVWYVTWSPPWATGSPTRASDLSVWRNKQQMVLLVPMDGILVNCRLTPSTSIGFPQPSTIPVHGHHGIEKQIDLEPKATGLSVPDC